MTGTKAGGKKAAKTNKELHGEDFFKRIGAKGGKNGCGPDYKGGFAANPELAKLAGAIGGAKSRRSKMPRDKDGKPLKRNGEVAYANRKVVKRKKEEKKGILKSLFGGKK